MHRTKWFPLGAARCYDRTATMTRIGIEAMIKRKGDSMNGKPVGALILIALGVIFLLKNLGIADIRLFEVLSVWWPVILIVVGVSMLLKRKPEK